MADTVTRRVKIGDKVHTVTLRPVDPDEVRRKRKEARLARLNATEDTTEVRDASVVPPKKPKRDGKDEA